MLYTVHSSHRKASKRPLEVYTPPAKRVNTSVSKQPSSAGPVSTETTQPERWHHRRKNFDKIPYPRRERLSSRGSHRDRNWDPSKWTEYDLKDVGMGEVPPGMSDEQINRNVAYQFLNEIKKQSQPHQDNKEVTDSNIVFRKPVARLRKKSLPNTDTSDEIRNEPLSQASTVGTLPEYVVGSEVSSSRRSLKKLTPLSSMEDKSCRGGDEMEMCELHSREGGNKGQEKVVARRKKSTIILSHLDEED